MVDATTLLTICALACGFGFVGRRCLREPRTRRIGGIFMVCSLTLVLSWLAMLAMGAS